MAPLDPSQLSARLDEHHHPETNGRMQVCRRCGFRVSGALGEERHTLAEDRPQRATRWLDDQARTSQIAHAKTAFDQ
ncbi:MAG TPA: hypothetical protein VGL60_07605 [Acidimicrobiales bacterium]|jgi:hypothetical protein